MPDFENGVIGVILWWYGASPTHICGFSWLTCAEGSGVADTLLPVEGEATDTRHIISACATAVQGVRTHPHTCSAL